LKSALAHFLAETALQAWSRGYDASGDTIGIRMGVLYYVSLSVVRRKGKLAIGPEEKKTGWNEKPGPADSALEYIPLQDLENY
jgi:hypothetical protein